MTNAKEVQLLIKTRNTELITLIKKIKELHSYKLPELIYWKISADHSYGNWIDKIIRPKDNC